MTYENDKLYNLNVYNRIDLSVKKAKGMYIYANNKKYLDLFSSIAVNSLGHRNKKVVKAIKGQLSKYLHLSNYFVSEKVVELSKLLVDNSFAYKIFYTNSGTEANEAAIKLIRLYALSNKSNNKEIVSITNSFHGRTYGGLSLTGQREKTTKFSPLIENIKFVERNNIESLYKNINENTTAVFLELIQGESGVNILSKEFVNEIYELKERYKFIVVIDEIQTGLMRTGKLFAYQHYNIIPDIVTIAKSIGSGLPLGAMLVSKDLEDVLKKGDHGSTFGGNPVSCSAGVSFFKQILKPKLCNHINYIGCYLLFKLYDLKDKHPRIIKEVRGIGLMIGIEISEKYICEYIRIKLFKKNILINVTNNNIIRLLPPFIIKKKHVDFFIDELEKILQLLEVIYV